MTRAASPQLCTCAERGDPDWSGVHEPACPWRQWLERPWTTEDIAAEVETRRATSQRPDPLVALADLVERYGAALREVEAQRRRNGAADDVSLVALESSERDVFLAVRR